MTASEGDFCYGLVWAIDRDTRSQGLQLPPIPSRQAFATQPYPTLEDWLDLALRYDDDIVDEILHLTRCQPYLLQLIGSTIVNQANLQHTQLATTALLQAAIQDAFTNGEPYFTNIWTEFTGTTPAEVIDRVAMDIAFEDVFSDYNLQERMQTLSSLAAAALKL